MEKRFESFTFSKRIRSMLRIDLRRMFTTRFFYIMVAACLVMPVLILVMTTMMDGSVSVDPQTGKETVMEGFDNVWQIVGSVSGDSADSGSASMDMSITSMCNINMLYFIIAVVVCIFVSEDFRSGYAKNLFAYRSKKNDYVISKAIVCFLASTCMIFAFFIGALLGGAVSGLSFEMTGFAAVELVMCIISKMLLTSVFVAIYLVMSVAAKQKAWLSILLSFVVGMFLFMMIPMMTPLNSSLINVLMCFGGGLLFNLGLGAVSNTILKKTSLV